MSVSLTNKSYDALKWIAQILLPAAGASYFSVAQIWSLPYATEVVGTITVIDTLLGALLGLTSSSYYSQPFDGTMTVAKAEDGRTVNTLEINRNPEELQTQSVVTLKVNGE